VKFSTTKEQKDKSVLLDCPLTCREPTMQ
jgi:hypothetical protein